MKLKVLINGVETMECTNEAVIHTSKIALHCPWEYGNFINHVVFSTEECPEFPGI